MEDDNELFWNYIIYGEDSESDEDFNSKEESSSAGKDSFDSDFDNTVDDDLVKGKRKRKATQKNKRTKNK
jgi:hypothetical protein